MTNSIIEVIYLTVKWKYVVVKLQKLTYDSEEQKRIFVTGHFYFCFVLKQHLKRGNKCSKKFRKEN